MLLKGARRTDAVRGSSHGEATGALILHTKCIEQHGATNCADDARHDDESGGQRCEAADLFGNAHGNRRSHRFGCERADGFRFRAQRPADPDGRYHCRGGACDKRQQVNKKRDDADAKARIEEVQKKLEAGEDFASLAKEYSDDIASAKSGGDLGYAGRGIYDPAFEKALFDLKKVGDVSGIVKTQFGYHIIKLTGIEKPKVESFEDKKAALKAELIKSKAMDKLNDAIDDLNRLTYESGDLSAIAEKYHKKVQVSEPFTHQGGNGITANKKVIDAAFSEPVLKEGANSDAIQLEDGTVVVLRLEKHFPARTQTLDEVKSQVQEAVVDEKARDKARDVANEIVKKLDSGSTQDAVAAEYKVTWTKKEGVTRRSTDVSQGIVSKLFGMPKPGKSRFVVDTLAQPSGDEQVLVLSKIEPGEFKLTDDEKLKAELAGGNHLGQQDFDNYMATLKQNAEIERK